RQGSDIAGDRPFIVIENHDQTLGAVGDIVERLHRNAAGEGGVANHRHDVFVAAAQVAGGRHPEGGGKGGAGVAGAPAVVGAFAAGEEPTQASAAAHLAEERSL